MMFERILVTGANGLLGQALVRRLSTSALYDVLATSNNPEPRFANLSCGYIRMDIRDRESVARVFEDFTPTTVINCAAMTQVDRCETDRSECWRVNARSVERIARECHGIGARLIQVSSDFVFDGEAGPYSETDRPSPLNFYGKAKLAGENAARDAGIGKWAVVRTNVVYGAGRNLPRNNFVSWVRQELERGHPINAFVDQVRTPTYAYDLAKGIERIVRFHKRGIYNISGCELVSMYRFAHKVAAAFGLDSSLVSPIDSSDLVQTAQRPRTTGFIILKAETELGFKPHSIPAALAHMERRISGDLCLT